MSNIKAPKLKALIREIGQAVINRFDGEWSREDYCRVMLEEIAKIDLNSSFYRTEIIRNFVDADVASRANVAPFIEDDDGRIQPSLFSSDEFKNGVITLGNGNNVNMDQARAKDFMARALHQQQNATAAVKRAEQTMRFMQETVVGQLLQDNPSMKMFQAMRQLGLWDSEDCDGK